MAFEIERKYIIKMPDIGFLTSIDGCKVIEITQTYLLSEDDVTSRVRKSVSRGTVTYTKTLKYGKKSIKRVEIEDEITEDEYKKLLEEADPKLSTIYKTRYAYLYKGQKFEIDVFPFWHKTAICETELEDEDVIVEFPEYIEIIREVSLTKGYSNRAFAKKIPPEDEI